MTDNDSATCAEVVSLPHAIAIETPSLPPMAPPDYAIYHALLERVKAFGVGAYAEVTELEAVARGYVWGVEDTQGHRLSDRVASWDFSHIYGYYAARYALGEITHRRPVQDAYKCWMAGHNVYEREHTYCEA